MKNTLRLSLLLFAALLVLSCSMINLKKVNLIKPSDKIVTESREVSGFNSINIATFGKVILTQGESESLSIQGSDNLVPLVKTTVSNGNLTIDMEEDVDITGVDKENVLTFTISVKDLTGLTISGLGDIEMDDLITSELKLIMSGAGNVKLGNLSTQNLEVSISGLGNVEIAGQATQTIVSISGAGELSAGDLQCLSANVSIPGLGGATLWVTDQLTGEISGGGNVSYYGNPQTDFETTGLGEFKSLGNK